MTSIFDNRRDAPCQSFSWLRLPHPDRQTDRDQDKDHDQRERQKGRIRSTEESDNETMDERRWEINQALTAAYMQYAAIEPRRKPVLTKVNSSIILFAGTLLLQDHFLFSNINYEVNFK
jgi:hypothetical protein